MTCPHGTPRDERCSVCDARLARLRNGPPAPRPEPTSPRAPFGGFVTMTAAAGLLLFDGARGGEPGFAWLVAFSLFLVGLARAAFPWEYE